MWALEVNGKVQRCVNDLRTGEIGDRGVRGDSRRRCDTRERARRCRDGMDLLECGLRSLIFSSV